MMYEPVLCIDDDAHATLLSAFAYCVEVSIEVLEVSDILLGKHAPRVWGIFMQDVKIRNIR